MDGKLYCIGTYTGALVLMYNKDLFDKAGVPYPSSTVPMTVDEYAEIARKLSVDDADPAKRVYGAKPAPRTGGPTCPTSSESDLRTVVGVLDDEATIHTWDVLAGLVRDGHALTDDQVASMGGSGLFATGQQAMSFEDNFAIGDLLEQGVNVGVAPLPVETAGQPAFVPSWTDAWSTFVTSKHPDQALDFIEFMATEGNVLREAGGAYPLDQQLAVEADYAADSAGEAADGRRDGPDAPPPVRAGLVLGLRPARGHLPPGRRERGRRLGPPRRRPGDPGRPGPGVGDMGQPVGSSARCTAQ